jgi:hypothetical protein
MRAYTFDTSVIIAYKVRDLPADFVLSAVVIAELTAGAADDTTRKVYEAMRREFRQMGGDIFQHSRALLAEEGRSEYTRGKRRRLMRNVGTGLTLAAEHARWRLRRPLTFQSAPADLRRQPI